ncbi:hypothetical protein MRB53_039764 [Persea americana]|nr:hypothetical protein MRB53_039764 [Persea americana]
MRVQSKRVVAGTCAFLFCWIFYSFHPATPNLSHLDLPKTILAERRLAVAEAFQHAWDGYSQYCFGYDTLNPVSNTCENDFGGWGVTAIDALSTAIIFEKEDVVIQILDYIATLDFQIVRSGTKILVFEVAIRHFAGMISAWDLLNGPFSHLAKLKTLRKRLYEQMVALGNVLSCAFVNDKGIPVDWVDPLVCEVESTGMNTIAGVGTLILEFARLADLTENATYAKLAERAEDYLLTPQPEEMEFAPGLLGSHISIESGNMTNVRGSWGALSDSYYEYLIKAYLYNSSKYKKYLQRWLLAADSTIQYVASHPYGHPEWTLLPEWDNDRITNRMESLSWFAGGNIILGGMVTNNKTLVDFGLSIADAAGAVYNLSSTGLGAEFVSWKTSCNETGQTCDESNSLYITDGRYRLRPEALETWYYAHRATKQPQYREWAWSAFEAINRTCRTSAGFSAIADVNPRDAVVLSDKQESFVFAEVMKYVYLIHLDSEQLLKGKNGSKWQAGEMTRSEDYFTTMFCRKLSHGKESVIAHEVHHDMVSHIEDASHMSFRGSHIWSVMLLRQA